MPMAVPIPSEDKDKCPRHPEKKRFSTERAARESAKDSARSTERMIGAGKKAFPFKGRLYPYHCKGCDDWHLTHLPQRFDRGNEV